MIEKCLCHSCKNYKAGECEHYAALKNRLHENTDVFNYNIKRFKCYSKKEEQ